MHVVNVKHDYIGKDERAAQVDFNMVSFCATNSLITVRNWKHAGATILKS